MLEALFEAIIELVFNWLGWRFWVAFSGAVILGFIIVPLVPEGDPTTFTIISLVFLGLGGGFAWRAFGGRE